jgi:hypothetical protein
MPSYFFDGEGPTADDTSAKAISMMTPRARNSESLPVAATGTESPLHSITE